MFLCAHSCHSFVTCCCPPVSPRCGSLFFPSFLSRVVPSLSCSVAHAELRWSAMRLARLKARERRGKSRGRLYATRRGRQREEQGAQHLAPTRCALAWQHGACSPCCCELRPLLSLVGPSRDIRSSRVDMMCVCVCRELSCLPVQHWARLLTPSHSSVPVSSSDSSSSD